jgi:hypothetical protein
MTPALAHSRSRKTPAAAGVLLAFGLVSALASAEASAALQDTFPGTTVAGSAMSAAGSNVGATAEASEPTPAGGTGTVCV